MRSGAIRRSAPTTPSASTRSPTCTATSRSSTPPAASTAATTSTTAERTRPRSRRPSGAAAGRAQKDGGDAGMSRHAEPVSAGAAPRVLIIEDDLKLGRTLVRGLREAGFTVEMAPTGEAALGALLERPADVVMLDVVLPGIDGFETCRRLRETASSTPVVMLSARGGVADRVAGLDAGADDYLGKPFSFVELVARLRALVRRRERRRTEPIGGGRARVVGPGGRRRRGPIGVGPLRIDPAARTATRDAVELQLTAREFDLLEAPARRAGHVGSRDWLLEQVWDVAYEQRSNVVDAYVRLLRAKLDRPFASAMLHTVRGTGYRLQAPS